VTRADGTRAKRTTKQIERDDALRVALAWQNAEDLVTRGHATEAQLRKILSDTLSVISPEASLGAIPVRQFLGEWVERKQAARGPGAGSGRYASTISQFLDYLGPRAERPLSAISTCEIQGFLAARQKIGRAAKTIIVDAKTLRAVFATAWRQGLIQNNPALATELPRAVGVEREPFTPAEVALLVQHAPSRDWRLLLLCGYYLGARQSDLLALQWSDFDFVQGVVVYRQRKTGEKVVTPLHPELLSELERLAGNAEGGAIMPSLSDRKSGGRTGLAVEFTNLMRSAGLDERRVTRASGRTFPARSFHSLRHSFESALANAGVAPEVRRELTGRAGEDSQKIYTHLQLRTLKDALAKLPTLS
jgi:integrase